MPLRSIVVSNLFAAYHREGKYKLEQYRKFTRKGFHYHPCKLIATGSLPGCFYQYSTSTDLNYQAYPELKSIADSLEAQHGFPEQINRGCIDSMLWLREIDRKSAVLLYPEVHVIQSPTQILEVVQCWKLKQPVPICPMKDDGAPKWINRHLVLTPCQHREVRERFLAV